MDDNFVNFIEASFKLLNLTFIDKMMDCIFLNFLLNIYISLLIFLNHYWTQDLYNFQLKNGNIIIIINNTSTNCSNI